MKNKASLTWLIGPYTQRRVYTIQTLDMGCKSDWIFPCFFKRTDHDPNDIPTDGNLGDAVAHNQRLTDLSYLDRITRDIPCIDYFYVSREFWPISSQMCAVNCADKKIWRRYLRNWKRKIRSKYEPIMEDGLLLIDLIGTYAYYFRKVWVYVLSAEGPLNSTRLI